MDTKLIATVIIIIVAAIVTTIFLTQYYDQDILPTKNLGEICSDDSECLTPMSYMVRSNCPFNGLCINNKCGVGCMQPYPSEEAAIKEEPQCSKDSECDCKFYFGNDSKSCICHSGLCTAIVDG